MFIPISPDAPIYHRPWITLLLIAANLASFIITGFDLPENQAGWEGWLLHYGRDFNPLEWISCLFVHFDPVHLLGNMLFLWGFGLVVEGKVGWWRYMLVYL